MTRAEEKAWHRGKLAAFHDAQEPQRSQRARCEFRTPLLRRRWLEGYEEQKTAAAARTRTPEQEANVQGVSAAIKQWLAQQR